MRTERAAAVLLMVLLGGACAGAGAGGAGRFPLRAPMWRDDDEQAFAPRPRPQHPPELWNTVDNSFFRPVAKTLAVALVRVAIDVNALDEVPDSSWFENRLGVRTMTREELVAGACTGPAPEMTGTGTWTVFGGKPDGANHGFLVAAPDGRRYLLKLDGTTQGERATAGDTLGALVYHAAGYHVPCNRVVFFARDVLRLGEHLRVEDFVGDQVELTAEMLAQQLERSVRLPDGRIRASVSELLPGKPLGPWTDVGTRADDPNDAIAHEDRRELRGSYVFAAWLDRYDSREQNSLDTWIEAGGGRGWVKHHLIDFGDCLGSLSGWSRVSRRRGHAYEVDWGVALTELLTFGVLDRPWKHKAYGPAGKTLGYYDVERFQPDAWHTAYPYGPFEQRSERDAAWAARILARFTPADVVAMVGEAKLADETTRREVVRVLLGRREKLLRRFLGRLSPLTAPEVHEGRRLCVRDAWVEAGLGTRASRGLGARVLGRDGGGGGALDVAWAPEVGAAVACVSLPAAAPGYVIVEWTSKPQRPLRVHLYAIGPGTYRVVGLERTE